MVTLAPLEPEEHDVLGQQLVTILKEVIAELMEHQAVPARVVTLAPGVAPAWDECCDGMLYSRVSGVTLEYPTRRTASGQFCGPIRMNVQAAIGVLRCAAVIDDRGVAPTAREITADGFEMTADLTLLQKALMCSQHVTRLHRWVPLGVDGGCHGGEWQFEFALEV